MFNAREIRSILVVLLLMGSLNLIHPIIRFNKYGDVRIKLLVVVLCIDSKMLNSLQNIRGLGSINE